VNFLFYYLIVVPVSRLPYRLLYLLSDAAYYLFWYVLPYRKRVVFDNLRRCFPRRTESEIRALAQAFYREFCDQLLEAFKNFSIGLEEAKQRMRLVNPELLDALAAQGRSAIVCVGHYCNWELWILAFPPQVRYRALGIYKKMKSAFIDRKLYASRTRFGLQLVVMRDTGNTLRQSARETKCVMLAFDQSPAIFERCTFVDFLGRRTAAYFGVEKYARDFDFAVVYAHLKRERRGFYSSEAELLFEQPRATAEGEITQRLFDVLAKDIERAPEFWLWSHRRWKHESAPAGAALKPQ
jgi:KDO2-lipid IV(A) lauroyltransferase